jgi:hypothetical protein
MFVRSWRSAKTQRLILISKWDAAAMGSLRSGSVSGLETRSAANLDSSDNAPILQGVRAYLSTV